MTQMEAVMESKGALPAGLLYTLLTALGPKTLLKGESRPRKGEKVDPTARQDFEEVVKAAGKARSAAEFAKLIGAAAVQETTRSHGSITTLTVETTETGATVVTVVFSDGVIYISYYPAGTF